jgi:hypothetical protein
MTVRSPQKNRASETGRAIVDPRRKAMKISLQINDLEVWIDSPRGGVVS